jgi:hypothetical protein
MANNESDRIDKVSEQTEPSSNFIPCPPLKNSGEMVENRFMGEMLRRGA